jgi:hypothetical protein
MSDRLQELLRQRALIEDQLAWINREIAASQEVPPLPTRANGLTQTVPATPTPSVGASNEAEKILGEFKKDTSIVQTDARRGCLLIFSIAMGLFVLAVIVGYYFYGRHLGRWW